MARPKRAHGNARGCAKERIIQAAEELFAEQGYAATSVARIAEAAAANRALLYYYFRDKRDLYWAITRCGLDEILNLITAVGQAPGGPWERLEQFVRSYYELLLRRHNMARMVFRELMVGSEQLGLPIEHHARESVAQVRRMLEDVLRGGAFKELDPELTAFSLFGMIHVFFMRRLATGRSFPSDVVVAHTMALLRHGAQSPSARKSRSRRDAKGKA